jgi:hypothetical protein
MTKCDYCRAVEVKNQTGHWPEHLIGAVCRGCWCNPSPERVNEFNDWWKQVTQ